VIHVTVARGGLAIVVFCAATFMTAAPALADAAPPVRPGDTVGVPSGAVRDVFIEHEDLSMDLSSLNAANPNDQRRATVVATYSLRNDGGEKGIDLVFVTASRSVAGVQVLLDGAPLAAAVGQLDRIPASWNPPNATPDLQGGPDLPYTVDRPAGLTFHVDLSPGRHSMMTSYDAVPGQYSGDAEADTPVSWQLAFVLSLARQWEGFGDLALTVRVPPGWPAAVRPSLTRRGDLLTGDFSGVPADSIGVTTRMPLPPDFRSIAWTWGVRAVIVLGILVGLLGARTVRWPFSLVVLVVAPLLAVALAFDVAYGEGLRSAAVPVAQQSWYGAKGAGIESLLQLPAALVAGMFLGLLGVGIGMGAGTAWRALRHSGSSAGGVP
jgi:hypothetical protein